MYLLKHPEVEWQPWQVFIAFQLINWSCCAIVVFGNGLLPILHKISLYLTLLGLFITIVCLAAIPERHSSNRNVWITYTNETGGWNDALCFLIGLLNAAFAVGVPDCISHLAEEGKFKDLNLALVTMCKSVHRADTDPPFSLSQFSVPRPEVKVPQGIMIQIVTAFVTAFIYLIALFYSITDLGAIFDSTVGYFPTAAIYLQATESVPATVGLIAILFVTLFPTVISVFVTGGRMWWSLARDNALPFSSFFAQVNPKLNSPANATVLMS